MRTTVTGTFASSASDADNEPKNHRATRPSDRRPTTICCASLPISNRAAVPEALTEVSLTRSSLMAMPELACATQSRRRFAMP